MSTYVSRSVSQIGISFVGLRDEIVLREVLVLESEIKTRHRRDGVSAHRLGLDHVPFSFEQHSELEVRVGVRWLAFNRHPKDPFRGGETALLEQNDAELLKSFDIVCASLLRPSLASVFAPLRSFRPCSHLAKDAKFNIPKAMKASVVEV